MRCVGRTLSLWHQRLTMQTYYAVNDSNWLILLLCLCAFLWHKCEVFVSLPYWSNSFFFLAILHVVWIMLMHVHCLLSTFSIRNNTIKQGSVRKKSILHVPDPIQLFCSSHDSFKARTWLTNVDFVWNTSATNGLDRNILWRKKHSG